MNERDFEQAQALAERFTEANVEATLGRSGPESHPRWDGLHCVDCGGAIPERAKLGRVRCRDCQEDKERCDKARLINGAQ